ncbi:unnamed protein product [Leptosia nina]|uniref:Uncharacterized protein n=1 Tax=Leptosia nina TaxID=320188 RepID=A0AAV1JWD6_9NEOP
MRWYVFLHFIVHISILDAARSNLDFSRAFIWLDSFLPANLTDISEALGETTTTPPPPEGRDELGLGESTRCRTENVTDGQCVPFTSCTDAMDTTRRRIYILNDGDIDCPHNLLVCCPDENVLHEETTNTDDDEEVVR